MTPSPPRCRRRTPTGSTGWWRTRCWRAPGTGPARCGPYPCGGTPRGTGATRVATRCSWRASARGAGAGPGGDGDRRPCDRRGAPCRRRGVPVDRPGRGTQSRPAGRGPAGRPARRAEVRAAPPHRPQPRQAPGRRRRAGSGPGRVCGHPALFCCCPPTPSAVRGSSSALARADCSGCGTAPGRTWSRGSAKWPASPSSGSARPPGEAGRDAGPDLRGRPAHHGHGHHRSTRTVRRTARRAVPRALPFPGLHSPPG